MNDHHDDDTMLSRTGTSNPGGKLIRRLDIPITEDLEDKIATLAAIHGISKSEAARGMLEELVYGRVAVMRSRLTGVGVFQQCAVDGSNAR